MDNEDLKADRDSVVCGRCGKYHDVSLMDLDDDDFLLCPMCQAESISCGCSDESQVEN